MTTPVTFRNTTKKLKHTLYLSTEYPLLFVSNAEVACSTIKRSIWTSCSPETFTGDSNLHDRIKGLFRNNLVAARKVFATLPELTKFGLVRNPFARFLSAYNDKVLRQNRDARVWERIAGRYGFALDARPGKLELLEKIAADDPFYVDQHFSPQFVNLSIGLIDFDFIGQLEHMEEIEAFLQGFGITISSHRGHETGAADVASLHDELGADVIGLIQEVYARDFAEFGYSTSPETKTPIHKVGDHRADERVLSLVLSLITAKNPGAFDKVANRLRALRSDLDIDALRRDRETSNRPF